MRFTFAEDLPEPPRPHPVVRWTMRGLTLALVGAGVVAAYELVAFAQDYWRALHG